MRLRLLLIPGFFLLANYTLTAQTLLGTSLNAEAAGDRFGKSVAISEDGRRVAVGGFFNDGAGANAGHVRTFFYTGSDWAQLDGELEGEAPGDWFGTAVAMSADGSVLAVGAAGSDANAINAGAVYVYGWIGNGWLPLGDPILGDSIGAISGASLALSDDGNTLAIGEFGYRSNRGQVLVYAREESGWALIGEPLEGEAAQDDFGVSVDLSADGEILAVGAAAFEGDQPGRVLVYRRTADAWVQIGADLVGPGDASFGESISLSADGATLAVGLPSLSEGSGQFRTYRREGNLYVPFGNTPGGLSEGESYGFRISLSAAGDRLAVAAPRSAEAGLNSGRTDVYELDGDNWRTLGASIDGPQFSQSGLDMDLSGDGNTVIIGAEFQATDGTTGGQARVYDLSELTSLEVLETSVADLRVYPNPASGQDVTVEVPADFRDGTIELIDAAGRVLARQPVAAGPVGTQGLRAGAYVVRVVADGRLSQAVLLLQ